MHSLMVRTAWQEKIKTKKSVSHLSITPTTRSDIGARGTICNMRAHNKPRGRPAFVRFQNPISHASMLENSLQQYCAQYSSLISFTSRICTAPKKKNGSHTCLYLFPRFSILVFISFSVFSMPSSCSSSTIAAYTLALRFAFRKSCRLSSHNLMRVNVSTRVQHARAAAAAITHVHTGVRLFTNGQLVKR